MKSRQIEATKILNKKYYVGNTSTLCKALQTYSKKSQRNPSKNLTVESTKMTCVYACGWHESACILHKYDVKLRVGLKWLRAGSNSYFL
jgi:hypothetical protein